MGGSRSSPSSLLCGPLGSRLAVQDRFSDCVGTLLCTVAVPPVRALNRTSDLDLDQELGTGGSWGRRGGAEPGGHPSQPQPAAALEKILPPLQQNTLNAISENSAASGALPRPPATTFWLGHDGGRPNGNHMNLCPNGNHMDLCPPAMLGSVGGAGGPVMGSASSRPLRSNSFDAANNAALIRGLCAPSSRSLSPRVAAMIGSVGSLVSKSPTSWERGRSGGGAAAAAAAATAGPPSLPHMLQTSSNLLASCPEDFPCPTEATPGHQADGSDGWLYSLVMDSGALVLDPGQVNPGPLLQDPGPGTTDPGSRTQGLGTVQPNLALLSGWAPLCPTQGNVPAQGMGRRRGSDASRRDEGGANSGPSTLYEVVASQRYDGATQQQVRRGRGGGQCALDATTLITNNLEYKGPD